MDKLNKNYNPVSVAYEILCDAINYNSDLSLSRAVELAIGYLGEALDENANMFKEEVDKP